MFNVTKIRATNGAGKSFYANHLSANDYYSESEKIVGHWRGILSFDFDLVSREVDMESFSMFQRGINPVTGGKLTQRHVTNGPRFFDFQCAAPKSVSIMSLFDRRLEEAHREAVTEAMLELEKLAAVRLRKGENVFTNNLEMTGRIIYVGDGKGADSLDRFWKKVRKKGLEIRYVATDLSAAFISSVSENCPKTVHVFDHFHVMKLMNDKLDEIRRVQYNMEKNVNKRKVLKGTRYLLLKNGADICDKEYKTRLENALAMNRPLSEGYYLKEQLREIWMQPDRKEAELVLLDWVNQARESKVPQLMKMASTVMAYRTGILAWYDCHISTGKVEGINNKIKVLKRTAYGFRDERYFELRLFALHDCRITRNVG